MEETEECRTAEVLRRLDADDVHRAVKALPAHRQQALARTLHTPVTVLAAADGAADLVRRRARGMSRARVSALARDLVEVCVAETVDALGDHFDDPSYDELVAVLDDMIARWDVRIVALLLAGTADGDFPARAVCERVLDEDPRFALDELGPIPDESVARPVTTKAVVDEQALEAKRERRRQRREAKPAKKGTTAARPSYRKKPAPADHDSAASDDLVGDRDPELTVGDRPLPSPTATMRRVTIVGNFKDVRHDDPLIGAVVTAFIEFRPLPEVEPFGKTRPCVVIAVCDGDELVVRPCYSEGGMRSRNWRSVLISNPSATGLAKGGFVSDEEHLVKRAHVDGPIGWLDRDDWNML